MNRREFLGGLGAAAVLTSGGADAAAATTTVALISDLHVNGEKATHTSAELARTVKDLLALEPRPAKVVCFGDIADTHGRRCDYEAAKALLEPLVEAGLEIAYMTGNHDHRAAMAEFCPEWSASTLVPGRLVHVVAAGPLDLVLMDSLIESQGEGSFNEVNGGVDGGQLEWLAEFGKRTERPFLVCAHHDGRQMKSFAKAAMASSPRMCGYLHGHRHGWLPDALHIWGRGARAVRSVGLPSTGSWGDVGFALLRVGADRAVIEPRLRNFWFPVPGGESAVDRQLHRENASFGSCTFIF